MPASRMTGTSTASRSKRDVVRVAQPEAAADGRAERHHGGAPDLLEPAGEHRVVGRVRQHDEAVLGTAARPRASSSTASGSSVRSLPMTSSLTQSVPNASRASFAVRTASPAVHTRRCSGSTRTSSSWSNERSEPRPDARSCGPPRWPWRRPDSTSAVRSAWRLVIPPVPRRRREPRTSPAMVRASLDATGTTVPVEPGATREVTGGDRAYRSHLKVAR